MHRVIKSRRVIMLEAPAPEKSAPETEKEGIQEEIQQSHPEEALQEDAGQMREDMLKAAREETEQLIQAAQDEARSLTHQAEIDIENLRKKTEKEAYTQGIDHAGHEMEQLFARAQNEIDETIRKAYEQRDAMMDNLEPRIFKLALEIAEKILGYELDHSENAFLSMLRQALDSVKNESHVTLRVSSNEYVRFFKSHEVTMHTQSGTIKADVVNDPAVGFGGCLIETESGAIDAGVKAQLAQIARNLGVEEE